MAKGKVLVDGQERYILKCNFHTHYAEHNGDNAEIMVDGYYEAGYDCIALTEHDNVIKDLAGEKRAQRYAQEKYGSDFLVIVGLELVFNDRDNSGCDAREVLGLFLSEYIPTGRKSTRDYGSVFDGPTALGEIHRQGGIAIICHDNWMVWSLEHQAGLGKHPWMWDFRHGLDIDGWEVGDGLCSLQEGADRDLMLSHPQESVDEGYIVVADSDAHRTMEIEQCAVCRTYVFAESKTLDGVKAALLDRKTVAWCKGKMYGAENLVCLLEEYLRNLE